MDKNQSASLDDTAEIYRQRLMDISSSMGAINEPIACCANKEGKYTGRFYSLTSQAFPFESAEAVLIHSLWMLGKVSKVAYCKT